MKQPTEQEIKEFWEWCGFNRLEYSNGEWCQRLEPDLLLALPVTLDILFKYAVPKLEDYHLSSCGGNHEANVWGKVIGTGGFWVDDDPALALFWAIKQVMEAK